MAAPFVHGKLDYLADIPLYKTEKPYDLTIDLWHTPGAKSTNVLLSDVDVKVLDMSNCLGDFSVDVQGFQAIRHPTGLLHEEFEDDSLVTSNYYKECEDLLKERFGADQVCIFDHLLRKADTDVTLAPVNERQKRLGAAAGLHIDQTPDSARRRVAHCLPDQAAELLKGRVRILNVWRPLIEPIQNNPLLLCDYRSTTSSELVPSDLISPHYEGEQYWVRFDENQIYWHYKDITRRDVLIIKCYDSAADTDDSIAKHAPHTSFKHVQPILKTPPRESIEIRALVFS